MCRTFHHIVNFVQQAELKLLNDRRLYVALKSVADQGVELKRATDLLEELEQKVGRALTASGTKLGKKLENQG